MSPASLRPIALRVPRRDPEALRACLFGLFAAPLGWFVQLCAGYGLASWPCFPADQRGPAPLAGYEWTHTAMIVISVCGILLALSGCLACLRVLRRARNEGEGVSPVQRWERGSERSCFLALWGVVFGGGFALSALISTVALLMLPRCAG
jgi:hypothetical protein